MQFPVAIVVCFICLLLTLTLSLSLALALSLSLSLFLSLSLALSLSRSLSLPVEPGLWVPVWSGVCVDHVYRCRQYDLQHHLSHYNALWWGWLLALWLRHSALILCCARVCLCVCVFICVCVRVCLLSILQYWFMGRFESFHLICVLCRSSSPLYT